MEKYLTPEEVAELLAVSPKSIREWLRSGKIKGIKAGRLWRISPQALGGFLSESRAPYIVEGGTGEEQEREAGQPLREYTRNEIREFLEADKITPEIARKVERMLKP